MRGALGRGRAKRRPGSRSRLEPPATLQCAVGGPVASHEWLSHQIALLQVRARYFWDTARLEGREFYVAEVTEIAYDETFPEDTFRLEMPGVEFRRVVR
jgi:hypothetical protein